MQSAFWRDFSASLLAKQRRFSRQPKRTQKIPLKHTTGWRTRFRAQEFAKSTLGDWLPWSQRLAIRKGEPASIGAMVLPLLLAMPPLDLRTPSTFLIGQPRQHLPDAIYAQPVPGLAKLGRSTGQSLIFGVRTALSQTEGKLMQFLTLQNPDKTPENPVAQRRGRPIEPVQRQTPLSKAFSSAGAPAIGSTLSSTAQDPSLGPEPGVRAFLGRVLQFPMPPVNVFTGQAADSVVRQFDADAVTFGNAILFRHGRYNPHSAQGIALLGHELTHAALATARPQPPDRPPAAAAEERLAQHNERTVFQYLAAGLQGRMQPVAAPTPIPGLATPNRRTHIASTIPQTAPVGRNVDISEDRALSTSSGQPGLSAQQIRVIKEEFFQEFKRRLRDEYDRR